MKIFIYIFTHVLFTQLEAINKNNKNLEAINKNNKNFEAINENNKI